MRWLVLCLLICSCSDENNKLTYVFYPDAKELQMDASKVPDKDASLPDAEYTGPIWRQRSSYAATIQYGDCATLNIRHAICTDRLLGQTILTVEHGPLLPRGAWEEPVIQGSRVVLSGPVAEVVGLERCRDMHEITTTVLVYECSY